MYFFRCPLAVHRLGESPTGRRHIVIACPHAIWSPTSKPSALHEKQIKGDVLMLTNAARHYTWSMYNSPCASIGARRPALANARRKTSKCDTLSNNTDANNRERQDL